MKECNMNTALTTSNRDLLINVITTSIDVLLKGNDRVFWFGEPPHSIPNTATLMIGEGSDIKDKNALRIIAAIQDSSDEILINYGIPAKSDVSDVEVWSKKSDFTVTWFIELIETVFGPSIVNT